MILRYTRSVFLLLLPSPLIRLFAPVLSIKMGKRAKIGWSIILADKLEMGPNTKIGHGNLVKCRAISLEHNARIGHLNRIKGRIHIQLNENSAIGNFNTILRGGTNILDKDSCFKIGTNSNITSRHYVECLKNITIGSGTVIGGVSSQIWTHGYYHYPDGTQRFRIDGDVMIGNNVYVGSACVINPGSYIGDNISIGSHSVVAGTLSEPGLYVSQRLRHIPTTPEGTLAKLQPGDPQLSVEPFYIKPIILPAKRDEAQQ